MKTPISGGITHKYQQYSLVRPQALRRPSGRRARPQPPEPTYSVAQVAEIFDVTKQTVYKWLQVEDDDPVIPHDGWFKLPGSGHIRIKRTAVLILQGEQ